MPKTDDLDNMLVVIYCVEDQVVSVIHFAHVNAAMCFGW